MQITFTSPKNEKKKENLPVVFSCEFCEISKNTFFTEHLRTAASGYVPDRKRLLSYSFNLDFPSTHFKETRSRISRNLIDINIILIVFFYYLIKLAHKKFSLTL